MKQIKRMTRRTKKAMFKTIKGWLTEKERKHKETKGNLNG